MEDNNMELAAEGVMMNGTSVPDETRDEQQSTEDHPVVETTQQEVTESSFNVAQKIKLEQDSSNPCVECHTDYSEVSEEEDDIKGHIDVSENGIELPSANGDVEDRDLSENGLNETIDESHDSEENHDLKPDYEIDSQSMVDEARNDDGNTSESTIDFEYTAEDDVDKSKKTKRRATQNNISYKVCATDDSDDGDDDYDYDDDNKVVSKKTPKSKSKVRKSSSKSTGKVQKKKRKKEGFNEFRWDEVCDGEEKSTYIKVKDRDDLDENFKIYLDSLAKPGRLRKCKLCEYSTTSPQAYYEHEAKHTGVRRFQCQKCEFASKTKNDLIKHQRKHATVAKYKCKHEGCNFATKWPRNMSHHVMTHTTERPYACELCGYTFKRKQDLSYHMFRHNDDKPKKCDLCDFRCKTNFELDSHKLKHFDVRPFACTFPGCTRSTKTKSDLTKHMKCHRVDRPELCPLCGKGFKCKRALKSHMDRHSTDLIYTCDLCDKKFKSKQSVRNHLKIHEGIKPYKCDFCDMMFFSKHNQKVHMAVHSEDRPYRCPICPHRSREPDHLLAHIGTMHGHSYAYFCELCRKPYSRYMQLKLHYQRMHTEDELDTVSINLENTSIFLAGVSFQNEVTGEKYELKQTGEDLADIDPDLLQVNEEIERVHAELALGESMDQPAVQETLDANSSREEEGQAADRAMLDNDASDHGEESLERNGDAEVAEVSQSDVQPDQNDSISTDVTETDKTLDVSSETVTDSSPDKESSQSPEENSENKTSEEQTGETSTKAAQSSNAMRRSSRPKAATVVSSPGDNDGFTDVDDDDNDRNYSDGSEFKTEPEDETELSDCSVSSFVIKKKKKHLDGTVFGLTDLEMSDAITCEVVRGEKFPNGEEGKVLKTSPSENGEAPIIITSPQDISDQPHLAKSSFDAPNVKATLGLYKNFRLPLATKGFNFNFDKTGKKPKTWFMEPKNILNKFERARQIAYMRKHDGVERRGKKKLTLDVKAYVEPNMAKKRRLKNPEKIELNDRPQRSLNIETYNDDEILDKMEVKRESENKSESSQRKLVIKRKNPESNQVVKKKKIIGKKKLKKPASKLKSSNVMKKKGPQKRCAVGNKKIPAKSRKAIKNTKKIKVTKEKDKPKLMLPPRSMMSPQFEYLYSPGTSRRPTNTVMSPGGQVLSVKVERLDWLDDLSGNEVIRIPDTDNTPRQSTSHAVSTVQKPSASASASSTPISSRGSSSTANAEAEHLNVSYSVFSPRPTHIIDFDDPADVKPIIDPETNTIIVANPTGDIRVAYQNLADSWTDNRSPARGNSSTQKGTKKTPVKRPVQKGKVTGKISVDKLVKKPSSKSKEWKKSSDKDKMTHNVQKKKKPKKVTSASGPKKQKYTKKTQKSIDDIICAVAVGSHAPVTKKSEKKSYAPVAIGGKSQTGENVPTKKTQSKKKVKQNTDGSKWQYKKKSVQAMLPDSISRQVQLNMDKPQTFQKQKTKKVPREKWIRKDSIVSEATISNTLTQVNESSPALAKNHSLTMETDVETWIQNVLHTDVEKAQSSKRVKKSEKTAAKKNQSGEKKPRKRKSENGNINGSCEKPERKYTKKVKQTQAEWTTGIFQSSVGIMQQGQSEFSEVNQDLDYTVIPVCDDDDASSGIHDMSDDVGISEADNNTQTVIVEVHIQDQQTDSMDSEDRKPGTAPSISSPSPVKVLTFNNGSFSDIDSQHVGQINGGSMLDVSQKIMPAPSEQNCDFIEHNRVQQALQDSEVSDIDECRQGHRVVEVESGDIVAVEMKEEPPMDIEYLRQAYV